MKKLLIFLLMVLAALTTNAQTQHQADSLYNIGRELVNNGKAAESRPYSQRAMDMYKMLHGEVSDDYINALNAYAASFGREENYQKAIELEQQVMDLCDQLDHAHPRMDLFTQNMGYYCYLAHDYPKATHYWELALPLTEKYSKKYESLLNGLALMYEEMKDYIHLEHIYALMEDHNQHELTLPCEEVKCMLERGQYYASIGDKVQAKEWFLKAFAIDNGEETLDLLIQFGDFLGMTMNDYASNADYLTSTASHYKEKNDETEEYFKYLNKAGICYFLSYQYQKSIDCYKPVIAFYQQFDSPEARSNIAKCQKNLGNAYCALTDYKKATDCFQKAIAYYETYDKNNDEYPKLIARLASSEKSSQDYDDAIMHYKQAMQIFEERGLMEDYSSTANSLQLCYFLAGINEKVDTKSEVTKAARTERCDQIIHDEIASLQSTRIHASLISYAHSLATIAGCYEQKEMYNEAITYYQEYIEAIREAIRSDFSMQSEAERMITWNQEKFWMKEIKRLLITIPVENESLSLGLNALVYDAALLSKGILLNSSIEFEKVIANKGDTYLKKLYDQSKANNDEIERLRKTSGNNLEAILQLTRQNQELELQLYKDCKELDDFTNYISYTWNDVQNTLKENDIAIEFLAINAIWPDDYMVALALTKDTPYPVAVTICTLEEVKAMSESEQLYESDNLVWGNLGQLLEGKQRIFFSADGGFNHIGIEYLQYNGKPLSEQFEVYRLSSTKELCMHHQSKPLEYIALFGDINYDDESTRSESTEIDLLALRYVDSEFSPLKSTKKEMDEIESILKSPSKTVAKLTNTEASQSAFLNLSNSNVNLIHIATHGAYLTAEHQTEEESMQNSILAFAGANLYEDTHDGILTAADIAKMNLRHCDLVVLSACETGLGKLGDDGVFGLQRGFKNAGVHTLMMSTKKVYDNTTATLMVNFYRHLNEGLSKREALVKAQQEVRDSGYTDAKYWATFILLDATE